MSLELCDDIEFFNLEENKKIPNHETSIKDSTIPATQPEPDNNTEDTEELNVTNIQENMFGDVLQEIEDEYDLRYPIRRTQRIPKKQNQPDLNAKGKYEIGNYVSRHWLASSHVTIVNNLFSISIPHDVQKT